MEYIKFFEELNTHNINYLVCGGLAVNIYGIPRMAEDIDILLEFTESNLNNFDNCVEQLMLQNSTPISLKTFLNKDEREKANLEKNLIAYSHYSSQSGYMNLDVLLDVPLTFELMWQNKTTKTVKGTNINIVGTRHLKELKKYANGSQDKNSVILFSKLLNK
jgi:hypothetical protein